MGEDTRLILFCLRRLRINPTVKLGTSNFKRVQAAKKYMCFYIKLPNTNLVTMWKFISVVYLSITFEKLKIFNQRK